MLQQQKMSPVMSSASRFNRLVPTPKVLTSSDLLGSSKMIIIRHAGEEYRLSITSKDKLILTK
jgi:hemin uptake protein HemP